MQLTFRNFNSQALKTPTSNVASQQPSRTATPTQNRPDCHSILAREENSQSSCSYGRAASNSSTKSREPSGPQDELLEIINDFKNNVFTITEVERLVENWRNRNDVQQSFKDKQRQLTAMREEYERIQKRMKEEMKTPTPFDKIRKFFSKGKKGQWSVFYTGDSIDFFGITVHWNSLLHQTLKTLPTAATIRLPPAKRKT